MTNKHTEVEEKGDFDCLSKFEIGAVAAVSAMRTGELSQYQVIKKLYRLHNEALTKTKEEERQRYTPWFTDDVFWNNVMGSGDAGIISIAEFIERAEKKYKVARWRLIPEYKPETLTPKE